jgi:hypothetical protein
MKAICSSILALVLISWGCSQDSPTTPASGTASVQGARDVAAAAATAGRPGYEEAYYNDTTVMINAIELPQHAPAQAQADLYEVVYPIGWESMNVPPPQCDPCDHEGNGIDFTDYHDHVLDSVPGSPGGGEYRTLWHVTVVVPAYTQDDAHNAAVGAAYAAHLPIRSEAEVDEIVNETLSDGSPVAVPIPTPIYFLCAVVNPHAAASTHP